MREYIYKKQCWIRLVKLIDALGENLVRPFLRLPAVISEPSDVKKILVIKLDHLGDLLLATPSLKLLRYSYPNARITLVVGPWGRQLMEGCPYIDVLLVCSSSWIVEGRSKKVGWLDDLKLIRFLRKQRYDLFFELRGDFLSILIGLACKIPCRVGFGIAGGGWSLSHEVPFNKEKHQVEIMLDVVRRLLTVPAAADIAPDIFLQQAERRWAAQWLKRAGVTAKSPLIGIHVGAGYPSKRWNAASYAQLMKRLNKDLGADVLLVGENGDEKELDLPEGVFSAVGKTNIRQTAALLECCQLFVGNDSVPVHLAAAVSTPVVVLFSAANSSSRWAPYGSNVTIISKEKEVTCTGCERYDCDRMLCMKLISVDEVFNAVQSQLRAR